MGGTGVGAINRLIDELRRTEILLGIRKFRGLRGLTRIPRPDAIPFLIKKLRFKSELAVETAARDLRLATCRDFGEDALAWQKWFRAHQYEKREEWVLARLEAEGYPVAGFGGTAKIPILLEALKDQSEEIRLHAYLSFRTLAPNSARAIRYYPYHGSIGARRRALAKLLSWWRSRRKEYIARNPEIAESQKLAREIAVAHPLERPEEREDFTPEKWRKWEKDVADRYDMLVKKRRGSWLRRGLETGLLLVLSYLIVSFFAVIIGTIVEGGLFVALAVFLVSPVVFVLLWLAATGSRRRIVRAYSLSPDYHRQLMRRRHIQEVLEGRREFTVLQGIGLTCICMIAGAVIALLILGPLWPWEKREYILLGGVVGLICGILLSFILSLLARRKGRRG
jgi:hypothetical protein